MNITTVATFADALEAANYVAVPDDWRIAVTDVVQSTAAIAAGRYKDVNLAGAATIAGLANAHPGRELPFAFGGDGAVILMPPEIEETARAALKGVQRISRNVMSLDLRCAIIPVGDIRKDDRDVRIAYQTLVPGRRLAMLAGGGIDHAETLCKSPAGAKYLISADETTADADLTGLSCRWQPLKAERGVMLTAIVHARRDSGQLPRVYREVYAAIQKIVGGDASPVTEGKLRQVWPPTFASRERGFGQSLFTVYGQSLLGIVSETTGITIGGYDGRAYRRALPSHSDFRKYADSLRMVIDCSESEVDRIEAALNRFSEADSIDFGIHRASSALMTCFVTSTDDGGHVHFVDGADGGYALAAQHLKAKLKSRS